MNSIEQIPELEILPLEMWGRVRTLLQRPGLGEEPIGETSLGKEVYSNCFGTTVYLLGEESVEKVRRLSLDDNDLNSPSFFWINGRPGFIEESLMFRFL